MIVKEKKCTLMIMILLSGLLEYTVELHYGICSCLMIMENISKPSNHANIALLCTLLHSTYFKAADLLHFLFYLYLVLTEK